MLDITFRVGRVLDGDQQAIVRLEMLAAESAGELWKRVYLPEHYTHRGSTKYQYVKRDGESGSGKPWYGSYTHRKLQKWSHTYPHVWTGKSQSQTMGAALQTEVVSPALYTVKLPLPWYYDAFGPNTFKKARLRAKWSVKGAKPLVVEMNTVPATERAHLAENGATVLADELAMSSRLDQNTYRY